MNTYRIHVEVTGKRTYTTEADTPDEAIELHDNGLSEWESDDMTDPDVGPVLEVEKLNDPDIEGGHSHDKPI